MPEGNEKRVKPVPERASDRWISTTLSVVLHSIVVGLFAFGWWNYKQKPKPVQPAAIEAEVVDSKSLATQAPARNTPPPPEPEPEPVAPEPEPVPEKPPEPSPEEIAEQQREAEQVKLAEEKQAQENIALEKAAQEKEAAAVRERTEAEQKAKAEAEKKAREEEQRKAEEKRQADAKRAADEKRRKEEERIEAEREAELRRRLEAEERVMAARNSGAMNNWVAQITARIQRAWIRPPSAREGIDCTLLVTQVPGGEITNVRIASCNGDQAVRDSIEAAAYRASPLPPPPDPALFERNLEIRFRPVD